MIFAYLDPVTGSAIVQVLLGALAVVGLGWQYVRKGTSDFFNKFRKSESVDAESSKSPSTSA